MKIYCAIKLDNREKEYFIQNIGDKTVFFQQDIAEEQIESFLQSEVCFGNVPRAWVEQSVNLKWLQLESVGYDPFLDLTNQNVKISNLKGFFSIPVAESSVSGILALMRGMNELALLKEKKEWLGAILRPSLRMLEGSNVLILGAGAIGYQMKKLLSAFNCEVLFYDKFNPQAHYSLPEELTKAIPEADVIIGCLPESPETIHLLNEERLRLMKPTAILVNVGRGSLIDEVALAQKLINGSIAGAVLDVTPKEPLSADHPLWNCPNTILSQHTGGGYEEEVLDKVKVFLKNLQPYINNEPLNNLIP
jgi:glyoxylate/hydroxypyruvate reductase A